jgi:hypothetical protein
LDGCFGGGPMLGLGRLMVEFCLLRFLLVVAVALVVAVLARLCDRAWPCPSAFWPAAEID